MHQYHLKSYGIKCPILAIKGWDKGYGGYYGEYKTWRVSILIKAISLSTLKIIVKNKLKWKFLYDGYICIGTIATCNKFNELGLICIDFFIEKSIPLFSKND
jgi:hypothetical protein